MVHVIAKNISLDYRIYGNGARSLRRAIVNIGSAGKIARDAKDVVKIRALNSISFEAHEGDRVAIIGSNGAGKSTLLRVISSIYGVSEGSLSIDGHLVPLLDVSLGIQEEESGRKNIYYRGLMLGISRKEIEANVDEIIAFTELGDYIDLPVNTYSSGMKVRLAFAISTVIRPEILLMDEWIGAGDAKFIAKAEARVNGMVDSAKILFLASHSMALVQNICNKAMVLSQGEMIYWGDVEGAIAAYEAL